MINRFDAARKLAFKIVEKYRLTPPIDPFVVIKTMGFDIEEQSNNYGIEAYSELSLKPKVVINSEFTFLARKRFTLAHELGHIMIPWHNGDVKCNTDTPYRTIEGQRLVDTQELEANIFASELLMPHEWLVSQLANTTLSFQECLNYIGGFNSMIEKQKKQDGGCYVSTVLFDDESEVLHDRVKLGDIPMMTDKDYTVRGCTALIDAIGGAIHHIGNIHKYARNEDVPEHTMFVITTDGQENASHRYTSEQVKKMIERQKEKYGWEFLFIGANIDAVETAARYGISKDRAVNYNADGEGTHILYESVAKAVCNVRASAPLGADWSEKINADYQKRGKKSKK